MEQKFPKKRGIKDTGRTTKKYPLLSPALGTSIQNGRKLEVEEERLAGAKRTIIISQRLNGTVVLPFGAKGDDWYTDKQRLAGSCNQAAVDGEANGRQGPLFVIPFANNRYLSTTL